MGDRCNVQVSGKTRQCFQSGKADRETNAHDAKVEGIARSYVWVPPLWALSPPAGWGGAELAGPGRCLRQGASDHTHKERLSPSVAEEVLFLSHAALKSDGWYRKTKSCSFPVLIKVFFVKQ